jgi:hypothetical protein
MFWNTGGTLRGEVGHIHPFFALLALPLMPIALYGCTVLQLSGSSEGWATAFAASPARQAAKEERRKGE